MVIPFPRRILSVRKHLSADGLYALAVARHSERFRIITAGRGGPIPLVDTLMSAFAMFALKDPSLLAFEERRNDENMRNLFRIQPSALRHADARDPGPRGSRAIASRVRERFPGTATRSSPQAVGVLRRLLSVADVRVHCSDEAVACAQGCANGGEGIGAGEGIGGTERGTGGIVMLACLHTSHLVR